MEEDLELELLKRRKLEEYRKRIEELYEREREKREFEIQKSQILRKILTPEARSRIENIKLVRPELANQLEIQLIQLASTGKIKIPITDEELKSLLKSLQSKQEYRIKIYKKE